MVRSMTGFGRGEASCDGKTFTVEVRAVNNRYCDVFIKMPRALAVFEEKVRETLQKTISRGKLDVFVAFEDLSEESKQVVVDQPLAKAYYGAMSELSELLGLSEKPTLALISRQQDVFRIEKPDADEDALWRLLEQAVKKASDNLIGMREREGRKLAEDILAKGEVIESLQRAILQRSPNVVAEYKVKIESRLKDWMDQQVIDPQRIAAEVAIFADRCSVDEEIVRLKSHIGQLRETLGMNTPVGRKLDFIVQEMNREINTIGSKANDLEITRAVIDAKSEMEKIREQIQNIE